VPSSFIADVIHQNELVQQCPEAANLLLKAYRWHNSAKLDTRAVSVCGRGEGFCAVMMHTPAT
jgi:hypothetical protein